MIKQIRKSLITRLMAYFALTGLLFVIFFSINFALGLKLHFKQEALPNISQYLEYIISDVGSPPDLDKAKKLAENLSIQIAIRGPAVNWQSLDSMPTIDMIELEPAPAPYHQYQTGHYEHNVYALHSDGDYQYLFGIGRLFKRAGADRNSGLGAVIVVTILILFLLIRSSLKPLNTIGAGVKKIAEGDLDTKIEVQQSNEFNQLADGINEMAGQVKSMLEAKQQLLLAISHELRSPLTRAKVNLELLPSTDIQQALAEDITEMQELVSLILESERLNQTHAALNKTSFFLDELIETVNGQYFSSFDLKMSLEKLQINADQTRVSLLLKNIIDNALKYSEESSQAPSVRLFKQNSKIVIEVEDYGSGMPNDELQRITEAFYRVDSARLRSTGGFGLGLYLCRLIVNAHQGDIVFESELNQGTLVRIILPE